MRLVDIFKQYMEHLFAGNRGQARHLMFDAHDRGFLASKLLTSVLWPAMEQIRKLYADDHIERITEHMATRINRTVADQLAGVLAIKPRTGQRMIVLCGKGEAEELGAQITTDLFQAEGWTVWFLGAGVPNDEVLQFCGKSKPDVLTIYGTKPEDVTDTKELIQLIRDVGACENMRILVTGGVFNRAEGLHIELKADLFALSAKDAIAEVTKNPLRTPKVDKPQPGRRRKKVDRSQAIEKAEEVYNQSLEKFKTHKVTVKSPSGRNVAIKIES